MADVRDNLLYLQRQVDRRNTTTLGPVLVAAGEGSLTFTDAAGNVLITMDEAGTVVRTPQGNKELGAQLGYLYDENRDRITERVALQAKDLPPPVKTK